MEQSVYEAMVQKAARAICAATNIAQPGEADVIFDAPDDLTWDASLTPPRPVPRWRLYEERGRKVVGALNIPQIAETVAVILKQIERGRNAPAPQVIEHVFLDIETLVRSIIERAQIG